eukprot:COSAG02_NODE_1787_length_10931_cov_2.224889_8_plen_57_part_00
MSEVNDDDIVFDDEPPTCPVCFELLKCCKSAKIPPNHVCQYRCDGMMPFFSQRSRT